MRRTENRLAALICFFLITWCFVKPLQCHASDVLPEPVNLSGEGSQNINAALYYLDDPTGNLTIEDIVNGKGGEFKPLTKPNYGFSFVGIRWVRFGLRFPDTSDKKWFIEQTYLHVQNWRVYYPTSNGFEYNGTSEDLPTSFRPYHIHNLLLELPRKTASPTVFYSSFEPRGHALNIDLSILPQKSALEQIHGKALGLGLFFGGLAVLLVYNTFLCISLRSKHYLLYVYYLSFFIAGYIYLTGIAPLVVDLSVRWEQFFSACCFLMVHGMLLFGRHILRLSESFSFADKYLRFFSFLLLGGAVVSFFLPVGVHYRLLNPLLLLSLPMLIFAGVKSAYEGYPPARIYAVGWGIFVVALIVYSLVHLGLLPPNLFTLHAIQVAAVLEASLFSFALALRFKLNSEAAASAKNSFIAMVSHELRTPLQTIVSCLDIFSVDQGFIRNKKAFARLKSAAEHLEMQVKDLTDFARLESGKLTLRESSFDVSHLIHEVVEAYLPTACEKGLSISTDISQGQLFIVSDPLRIKQILNNLIENAIKYSEAGSISVRMFVAAGKNQAMTIEVEDSGIGISPVHMKSVYDPFAQVDQGINRKYNGIGMGLAIVKNLVLLMGGKVELNSTLGKGSTFKVVLPYRAAEGDSNFSGDESSIGTPSRSRLLLVDDNDEVRVVLGEILSSLRYATDDFASGRSAVDAARNKKYDAVLLDVNMPDMDGFSVAECLRKIPMHRNTPIIWISATRPALSQRGCEVFTHFLEKPIHADSLKTVLASILH